MHDELRSNVLCSRRSSRVTRRIPIAPVLPVLTGRTLLGGSPCRLPSITAVGRPCWVVSGEAAILGALLLANVGPSDEVLVPAFHCPSMVNPIRALGATAVYYGINEDLTLNAADIEARLTRRTRAIIAPHLFGRVQRLAGLRDLCEGARIVLVEDCAHAFFGSIGGVAIGSVGHFAIASPRKFFPLSEGGVLTSTSGADLTPKLQRASAARDIRVAFDLLDVAIQSGRLPLLAPLFAGVKSARRLFRRADPTPSPRDATSSATSIAAAGSLRVAAASAVTRWIQRRGATEAAMQQRELNFRHLCAALGQVHGVRVLDTQASDVAGTVPYMVPVLLSAPHQQFAHLQASGTPMWRWEYSQLGVCKTTDRLAQAMIQLPCHQAMRGEDLAMLVRNVERAAAARGHGA
jgi:perosamine synthetase